MSSPRSRPASSPRSRPGKRGKPVRGLVEELVVERIATGGSGVARLADGRAVFIPRTLPEERIVAEIDITKSPAQGRLLRVLAPSAARVTPPCPYVEACGGCDFMHIAEASQQAIHAELVRSATTHATKIADLPAIRVHPAPSPLAYRTRARLFARVDRDGVRVGYRAAGSHEMACVDACTVLDPALAPIFAELTDLLAGSRGEGDVLVGLGANGARVIEVAWRGDVAPHAWAQIDALVRGGRWAGARVHLEGVSKPASFGDPRVHMEGADGVALVLAPGGFAQPSVLGAALLARRVAELAVLPEGRPRRVVELFAGSGTLSVLLARGAERFTGVEIDESAAACARENLALRELPGKMVATDADAFPIPAGTELVVLDPPRAGAAGAARAIAQSKARLVVYVSCDAATLARDLAIMTAGGLAIDAIDVVELFPQTSHVETIVRLHRLPVGTKITGD